MGLTSLYHIEPKVFITWVRDGLYFGLSRCSFALLSRSHASIQIFNPLERVSSSLLMGLFLHIIHYHSYHRMQGNVWHHEWAKLSRLKVEHPQSLSIPAYSYIQSKPNILTACYA